MRLLELILSGSYTSGQRPSSWNRMGGYSQRGATTYLFSDGIELRTYTGYSWFLYVDGTLVDRPEHLTNTAINDAFARARASKLTRL